MSNKTKKRIVMVCLCLLILVNSFLMIGSVMAADWGWVFISGVVMFVFGALVRENWG